MVFEPSSSRCSATRAQLLVAHILVGGDNGTIAEMWRGVEWRSGFLICRLCLQSKKINLNSNYSDCSALVTTARSERSGEGLNVAVGVGYVASVCKPNEYSNSI